MERTAEKELFDAVIIAAGVCSAPNYPDIPGLKEFKGKVIHNFDYRVPYMFAGMRVAVLGGLISGQDISVDVSQFAKEVIFSHKGDPLAWELPRTCVNAYPSRGLATTKPSCWMGLNMRLMVLFSVRVTRNTFRFYHQNAASKSNKNELYHSTNT